MNSDRNHRGCPFLACYASSAVCGEGGDGHTAGAATVRTGGDDEYEAISWCGALGQAVYDRC